MFHDSEGDAPLHHQINEHLEMCPECARWFYQQSRLEEALTEKLRSGELTQEIWSNVVKRCVTPQPAPVRSKSSFIAITLLLACIGVVGVGIVWQRFHEPGHDPIRISVLTELSAALHEELSTGREAVKFASTSHSEVEQYLRGQVQFPVRCPPGTAANFEVRGGGISKLSNDQVAYVLGRVDGQDVSLFIMAKQSLTNFPTERELLSREPTHQCREGRFAVVMGQVDRNLVMVVGEPQSEGLRQVLRTYGSHSGEHTGNGLGET